MTFSKFFISFHIFLFTFSLAVTTSHFAPVSKTLRRYFVYCLLSCTVSKI